MRPKTLAEAQHHKRYWNKIAIQTAEGVYSTDSEDRAVELAKKFRKKYPSKPPVVGYIPPGDTVMVL